jgi:hypothetical protein
MSFSRKEKMMVKLSVPYSSTTWMLSMAFNNCSSSFPMFSLIIPDPLRDLHQYPSILRADRWFGTSFTSSSVRYFGKSLSSASAMFRFPLTRSEI